MKNQQLFNIGDRFQVDGVAYRMEKLFPENGTVEVYNLGVGRHKTMSFEEILALWNSGKLLFEIKGLTIKDDNNGNNPVFRPRIVDFSTLPESQRVLAKIRLEQIQPLLKMAPSDRTTEFMDQYSDSLFQGLINRKSPEEKEKLLELKKNKKRLPAEFSVSPKQLRRHLKLFIDSRGDIRSLIDCTKERGGKGKTKLSPHVEALIQRAINEFYLKPNKENVKGVFKQFKDLFEKEKWFWPEHERIMPSRPTFYRRIRSIDLKIKLEYRYGKDVSEKCGGRLVGKGLAPLMPMERVAIDHYITKLIILDDDLRIPIGPGTISAMICEATRVMPGLSVGWDPPSYLGVMDCLYQGIRPKLDIKEKFHTQHDYLGYGLPGTLVTDNGKEFIGTSLEDAALQLKFTLEHNDAFSPFLKGKIERWFHTLFDDLIIYIPGATFAHIFDTDVYDAKKYACVTLSAFKRILTTYVCDQYHYQPHRGLYGKTPAEAWEAGIQKGWWPALPPNIDELHVLLGRKFRRSIQHYGIDFENIRYQNTESEVLINLRKKLLQQPDGPGRLVTVKVDPHNLGSIFVYDHIDTKKYVELQAQDPAEYHPEGLSLWAHRAIVKFRNKVNADKNRRNEINLSQARDQLSQIVQEEFEKTSSLRKKSKNERFVSETKPEVVSTTPHPYTNLLPTSSMPDKPESKAPNSPKRPKTATNITDAGEPVVWEVVS